MSDHSLKSFQPLNIAVLTVSDTRDESSDTSGQMLCSGIIQAGHYVCDKQIVKDDIYQIRAVVSTWIASDTVQAILITGGTGFTSRDTTPQAIEPLFDTDIPGFGELFRAISFQQLGSSTIQSRSVAGIANNVAIFAMPGSTNACKTAWNEIIREQLDSTHKPCNFVLNLKKTDIQLSQSRG